MARLDDATGSVVVRQRLDPHPSSVSRARRLVARALGDLGRGELADDAALVVSELVTNALVHAGTPIEVVVSQREADVVVEVVDDNPRLPFRRHHSELAGTGRGLKLVEQLTTAWGTRERPPGKSVWFQVGGQLDDHTDHQQDDQPGDEAEDLDLDALLAAFPDLADDMTDEVAEDVTAGEPERPVDDEPHDADVLEVVLLDLPLLLHAAWQLQAESVLRDYLLTRLATTEDDPAGVQRELEDHAAVHEALVLLQEQLPAPGLPDRLEEVMATAVEPLVTAPRLTFVLPRSALANFDRMGTTLDSAMELAESGALLTPPTQPEIRAFRKWLCDQITTQRGGAAPQPWRGDASVELPPWMRVSPEWDRRPVTAARVPVVAAADTNRIVAASPPAVALLGYDSEDELLGRRIVDIIPARFRQAHLAGFTLHLFSGRDLLLEEHVEVPVLRRDGTEVPVALVVSPVSLPDGRHVFIAEITELAR